MKACRHGHELTRLNTYQGADGRVQCRTCVLARQRLYDARRRAERGPGPGRWPSGAKRGMSERIVEVDVERKP